MPDIGIYIPVTDGVDKADLSIVHDALGNPGLGNGADNFADGITGWQWSAVGSPVEVGGVLDLSQTIASGRTIIGYDSNSLLAGDFDIQIDFSNFEVSVGTGRARMGAYVDTNNWFRTTRFKTSGGLNVYYSEWNIGGALMNDGGTATTDSSGKLRLQRIGSTVNYYVFQGGVWVYLFTKEGISTSPAIIKLEGDANDLSTMTADFDNFQINVNGIYDSGSPNTTDGGWIALSAGSIIKWSTSALDISGDAAIPAKFQYAVNNGAFNGSWLTLAQLQAESDTTITDDTNSVKVKVQFLSDGTQAASCDEELKITVAVATACDYAAASDLRLGITQDFGNITGTLAVPVPGRVIEGVATDDTVGTYKQVPEDNAELGFDYGAGGTEFTGTFKQLKGPIKLLKLDTGIKVIKI